MQKIKNIEFLRVIGCVAIILLHLFSKVRLYGMYPDVDIYHKLYTMSCNGQKAVDLFFMLSGFFFALKLDVTKTIWAFLKPKIQRFYPVLIFITIISFVASLFGAFEFKYYDNVLAFLGLNGTSLVTGLGNIGIFWYVSTMLWVFLLFYYLLKNYDKKHVNLFMALLIFFCYSFLIHAKGGKINHNIQTFEFIFNVGMMRGFAGIGVGYFIAQWFRENIDAIKAFVSNILQKLLITVLEFMCVFFIINNLMLHQPNFKNDMVYIVVFIIAIVLFLIKKGFVSQLLENDIWVNLSQYTYSFYMTHIVVYNILRGTFWKMHSVWIYSHPILNVVFTLILVFLLGVFTYHFVELPANKYFARQKMVK